MWMCAPALEKTTRAPAGVGGMAMRSVLQAIPLILLERLLSAGSAKTKRARGGRLCVRVRSTGAILPVRGRRGFACLGDQCRQHTCKCTRSLGLRSNLQNRRDSTAVHPTLLGRSRRESGGGIHLLVWTWTLGDERGHHGERVCADVLRGGIHGIRRSGAPKLPGKVRGVSLTRREGAI